MGKINSEKEKETEHERDKQGDSLEDTGHSPCGETIGSINCLWPAGLQSSSTGLPWDSPGCHAVGVACEAAKLL